MLLISPILLSNQIEKIILGKTSLIELYIHAGLQHLELRFYFSSSFISNIDSCVRRLHDMNVQESNRTTFFFLLSLCRYLYLHCDTSGWFFRSIAKNKKENLCPHKRKSILTFCRCDLGQQRREFLWDIIWCISFYRSTQQRPTRLCTRLLYRIRTKKNVYRFLIVNKSHMKFRLIFIIYHREKLVGIEWMKVMF
jgi:hypothetical protein